jgi:hypothetical protein
VRRFSILLINQMLLSLFLCTKENKERGFNRHHLFDRAFEEIDIAYNRDLLSSDSIFENTIKENLLGRSEGIENLFDVNFFRNGKHFYNR